MMTSPLRTLSAVTSSQSRKLLYWSPISPGLWLTAICCVRPAPSESGRATMTPSSTPSPGKGGGAGGTVFREEPLMGHGALPGLVAPLLFLGPLILNLERAGARLDHLLGKQ